MNLSEIIQPCWIKADPLPSQKQQANVPVDIMLWTWLAARPPTCHRSCRYLKEAPAAEEAAEAAEAVGAGAARFLGCGGHSHTRERRGPQHEIYLSDGGVPNVAAPR